MKAFLSGLVGAFLVGLVGFGFTPWFQKATRQPIQFNHQAHKDIDCESCHESAKTQMSASLPTVDLCLTCHETAITDKPEEEKFRTLAKQGQPIKWQRLFKQPAHVYYSHRRHAGIAKMECKQCHGGMGESKTPPLHVRNLSMSDCISCHDERGVRADCVDCHR